MWPPKKIFKRGERAICRIARQLICSTLAEIKATVSLLYIITTIIIIKALSAVCNIIGTMERQQSSISEIKIGDKSYDNRLRPSNL